MLDSWSPGASTGHTHFGGSYFNSVRFGSKFVFIVNWWCRFQFLYYFFNFLDSWPALGVGWPHPFWWQFIFQLRPIFIFDVILSKLWTLDPPSGVGWPHPLWRVEGVIIQCCLIWLKFCMYGNSMVLISFLILFKKKIGLLTPVGRRLATPILTGSHISTCLIWLKICIYSNLMVLISFLIAFIFSFSSIWGSFGHAFFSTWLQLPIWLKMCIMIPEC